MSTRKTMGKRTSRETYCVYVHEFPNGKRYFGQTCVSPEERWRNGKRYSGLMKKAIDKYGWENIIHKILFTELDADTADLIERMLIKLHKTNDAKYGYNITSGGDGYRGTRHSESTKELLRQRAKDQWEKQRAEGYRPPPITEEARANLSKAHLGQEAWNKGKHSMTEEMKQNLKEARRRFWEDVRNGKRENPNKRNVGDGTNE